jgi:hypothetical protein
MIYNIGASSYEIRAMRHEIQNLAVKPHYYGGFSFKKGVDSLYSPMRRSVGSYSNAMILVSFYEIDLTVCVEIKKTPVSHFIQSEK